MSVTSTSTNFCAVIFLPPKMFEAIFPCADHHLRVGIDRDLVPLFCFAWSSVKETTTITNTTGKYLPSSQVLEAVGMFFFFCTAPFFLWTSYTAADTDKYIPAVAIFRNRVGVSSRV